MHQDGTATQCGASASGALSGTMITGIAGGSIGSMFWNLVRNAKAGEQV
jgi:hypothetical protein